MVGKIIKYFALFLLLLIMAGALWFFQPWSQYSPNKLIQMQQPENLIQTFRSMDQAFPYRTINRSKKISDLPEDIKPLSVTYEWQGKKKTLAQFLKESTTTGLIVVKSGTIRAEQYFHKAGRETRFTSWSASKSFVATVIFMALKEGKIKSFDDKVEQYAPEFKGTGFGESTIRSLLVMGSGVNFDGDYAVPNKDGRAFGFKVFVLGFNPDPLLLPYKRIRKPLSEFRYMSPSTQILSIVLRKIYNKPFTDIISEKIWDPLGMEGDAYWSQNTVGEGGIAIASCCLNARLRDYARFGQFYLDAHKKQGKAAQLIPAEIPEMLQTPPTPHHKPGIKKYQGRGYSYHFWLPPDADGEYFASGVNGQYIWIDPKRDITIVRTSVDNGWRGRVRETAVVMKHIAASYSDGE